MVKIVVAKNGIVESRILRLKLISPMKNINNNNMLIPPIPK